MSCMKCGKEVSEDQVFCPECLAEMDRYPVKPGTPVLLPHREPIAAQRKRRPLKRVRKPEEQLAALRKSVRLLCLILFLLLAIAAVSVFLNFKLLGGDVAKILPALLR